MMPVHHHDPQRPPTLPGVPGHRPGSRYYPAYRSSPTEPSRNSTDYQGQSLQSANSMATKDGVKENEETQYTLICIIRSLSGTLLIILTLCAVAATALFIFYYVLDGFDDGPEAVGVDMSSRAMDPDPGDTEVSLQSSEAPVQLSMSSASPEGTSYPLMQSPEPSQSMLFTSLPLHGISTSSTGEQGSVTSQLMPSHDQSSEPISSVDILHSSSIL